MNWYESHDAMLWAQEFIKVVQDKPHLATDEGFIAGWIANAMFRGESRVYSMNDEKFNSIANTRRFIAELGVADAT